MGRKARKTVNFCLLRDSEAVCSPVIVGVLFYHYLFHCCVLLVFKRTGGGLLLNEKHVMAGKTFLLLFDLGFMLPGRPQKPCDHLVVNK